MSRNPYSRDASTCLLFALALILMRMSIGCGGAYTAPTLTAITVSPTSASMPAGETQQFTAKAIYSNGVVTDVASSAKWTSSNLEIATITAGGLATAVAPGTATVSASFNGVTGTAKFNAATKAVTSVAVSPPTASIPAGAAQQFTAMATYSDGSTGDVSSTATWSSSTVSAATINAAGLATGVAAGSATVTASVGSVSATATLTVTAKALTAIAVSPATATVAAGQTQQFTATATYSDSSTANVTTAATWTTASASVATITSGGLATGVAAGTTNVTAAMSGISATAALTVTAKTVTSIAVSPGSTSVSVSQTQQFTATATYSDNSTANVTSTATWTTGSASVATINSAGLATGVAAGSTTVQAALSGVSGSATLTVTATAVTSIAVTPSTASFAMGSTQQFTATATYSDGSTGNVTTTSAWAAANTAVAIIDSSGLATGVASGSTSVTATLSGVSGSASVSVTQSSGAGVNIPMFHVDANRSGLNPNETTLTTSNVSSATFGKLFSVLVDGYVYGTPLIMSNLTVNGAPHNVLYVATENDSVFAFDSDTGAPLWQQTLLQSGEAPIGGPINPYEGVTGTPVIDTSTDTLYVVSVQKAPNVAAYFRLNALDIATGAITSSAQIVAQVPATNSDAVNGIETLNTSCIQRAALQLAYGNVYIGFGGCHSGWLLAYDEGSLAQVGVFNMSPNDNGEGAYASAGGVWMGGGGPVADGNGNIFVTTGNGPYDPTALPATGTMKGAGAWADSVLRFNSTLNLKDSFTPQDYAFMDCNDADLASGGLMMIPGTNPAQVVAGGKMGKLYFLNSTDLGGEKTGDTGALQTLEWGAAAPGQSPLVNPYTGSCTDSAGTHSATINSFEIFGTSAYFNGSIYLGITPTASGIPSGIRQFTYTGGTWVPGTDTTQSTQQDTRGTTPFISANGTSEGILWMVDQGQPLQTAASGGPTTATLRAYDASDLSTGELYDSNQNGNADVPGYGIKFSSPVVANGKVYISTGHDLTTVAKPQGEINIYGLK